jgi:hypothetical protein
MKANNSNLNSSLVASFFSIIFLSLALWGVNNTEVALFLIEHPIVILPYLIDQFGYLRLFAGVLTTALMLSLFLLKPKRNLQQHNQN